MLKFKPMSEEDAETAMPIMQKAAFGTSETSFPCLYMWSGRYGTQICIDGETVFTRTKSPERTSYMFPLGGDTRSALLKIRESETGDINFHCVSGKMRDIMESAFPGEFSFTETRDNFDYIYLSEKLATLAGKSLHKKKNHINKFKKAYGGRYSYESLGAHNIPEVKAFQKSWLESSGKGESSALVHENKAISEVLDAFDTFGLRGGVLRTDGEICAYCIGSKSAPDTVDVMVEKASYKIEGAYQMINMLFAANECGDVTYINREDDTGDEGLRKAKLSYHPEILLKKYRAVWKGKV